MPHFTVLPSHLQIKNQSNPQLKVVPPWNGKFSNTQVGKLGGDTMNFLLAPPKNLAERFSEGHEWKRLLSIFMVCKCIPNNLNTMNLKIFSNHGKIYMFNRKFNNSSGGSGKLQVKSVSFIRFFFFFFGHKKRIDFKRSLELHFFASIIGFFYLPSFNSKLRKRYTLRLLLYLKRQEFWKFHCLGSGGK